MKRTEKVYRCAKVEEASRVCRRPSFNHDKKFTNILVVVGRPKKKQSIATGTKEGRTERVRSDPPKEKKNERRRNDKPK